MSINNFIHGFFVVQGKLPGFGMEELPVVAIVAHMDSFGAAPVGI